MAQGGDGMPGPREEFDEALEAIEAKVIELFAMIVEDLPRAARCLPGSSQETARVLAERERVADALCPEIERLAGLQILLRAPVASDLRFLLSVLRVAPELERSHDLIMQIAAHAGLAADLTPRASAITAQMGDLACRMWQQAADSWYQRDPAVATALCRLDQEMDGLHASLTAELATERTTAAAAMQATLVARCYDRLAAHALNIARRTAYLARPPANGPPR
jgi:phosphate transport system protein